MPLVPVLRSIWRIAAVLALLPNVATAGAWPREEGAVFLSFGASAPVGEATGPTLYAEYGLTPRLTLGLDGYGAAGTRTAQGLVFLRYALDGGDGANRLALTLGAGARGGAAQPAEAAWRIGLHWGRGLASGWLALDAQRTGLAGAGRAEDKVEATWGWRAGEGWGTIVALELGRGSDGASYARATPSLFWELGGATTLRLGVAEGLSGDVGREVVAQVWLSF